MNCLEWMDRPAHQAHTHIYMIYMIYIYTHTHQTSQTPRTRNPRRVPLLLPQQNLGLAHVQLLLRRRRRRRRLVVAVAVGAAAAAGRLGEGAGHPDIAVVACRWNLGMRLPCRVVIVGV